jgi:4-amino-4-deoxy-L-arabinose transferase-like glycosyltransferase
MSKAVTLGLLLGVSFLDRSDAVFLVAAVFIMMLWSNPASLKDRIAFSAVTGVSFLLVAAPYAIWNLLHFGHLCQQAA